MQKMITLHKFSVDCYLGDFLNVKPEEGVSRDSL